MNFIIHEIPLCSYCFMLINLFVYICMCRYMWISMISDTAHCTQSFMLDDNFCHRPWNYSTFQHNDAIRVKFIMKFLISSPLLSFISQNLPPHISVENLCSASLFLVYDLMIFQKSLKGREKKNVEWCSLYVYAKNMCILKHNVNVSRVFWFY